MHNAHVYLYIYHNDLYAKWQVEHTNDVLYDDLA